MGGLPTFIEESYGRLDAAVRSADGRRDGAFFVIYHGEVNEDSDGPMEVCLPFAGDLTSAGKVIVRTEPAHRQAFTTITRRQVEFPDILDAYAAVERWIEGSGDEITGSPREINFTDDEVEPDEPFCDIAFPIR